MRLIKLISLLSLLVSCGQFQKLITVTNSHDNLNAIRWEVEQFPRYITADENMFPEGSTDRQALLNAAATWNEAMGIEAIVIEFADVSHTENFETEDAHLTDNLYTTTYFDKEPNFIDDYLAQTVVSYEWPSNKLVHADIVFNSNKRWSSDNFKDERYGYDMETVYLHELGHFLGMVHDEDNEESAMYPYTHVRQINRELTESDITTLKKLYQLQ